MVRRSTTGIGKGCEALVRCLRDCGDDVQELLHDGHPTACVGVAALRYVNACTIHVNVGFFQGTELPDPDALLEGTGKFMRRVKLIPGREMAHAALKELIETAYNDTLRRLEAYGR